MSLQRFLTAGALAFAMAASAHAGEPVCQSGNIAGSLLVFPEFNNQEGIHQILSVTNTSASESVWVEIVYIDGEDCSEFNRNFYLTPRDNFSFLTRVHNPQMETGYAYAFAKSSQGGTPITFNYLVGQAVSLTPEQDLTTYSMNAFVFQGQTGHGNTTEVVSNGLRDLDGVEYSQAPDKIIIPRFFGQFDHPVEDIFGLKSCLYLIGLTGGARFETSVDFLIYNDNEEVFSSEYRFECWEKVDLIDISDVFAREYLQMYTNHDLGEILGIPRYEAGWMVIDGGIATSTSTSFSDPAFLAFLREGYYMLNGADLPFVEGLQDNGSLLARSQNGQF